MFIYGFENICLQIFVAIRRKVIGLGAQDMRGQHHLFPALGLLVRSHNFCWSLMESGYRQKLKELSSKGLL